MAAGFSIVGRGVQVTEALIATGWAPLLPLLAWTGTMAAIGLFAGMALLSAVFPTGALPGGGAGRMTRVGLALIAGVGLLQAVDPAFSVPMPDGTTIVTYNPIGIAPDWPGWSLLDGPAYLVVLGGLAICVVGLLHRFRRAGGSERQQFKWLLASLALIVIAVAFGFVGGALVDPQGAWIWVPALVTFSLPPIAIGVAIMRYRLYDIDRIISRTIAYVGVTLVLFAIFAAVNLTLQWALDPLIGGGSVAVAASTLAVAALFNPVRNRLQNVVDRRFNRARRDAELTAGRFAGRLRDQLDLDALGIELTNAAVGAVEPAAATFWLRQRKAVR
jgi:MFS family permease